MVELYKTAADFSNMTGLMPYAASVETAVPGFFSILIFCVWIFGTAGSYFAVLTTTGRKRFWQSLTALSFVCFLSSLLVSAMNTATISFLSGYWVGFYILMTVVSYYLLDKYQ